MTFEKVEMKYGMKIIGSPSDTGYPFYSTSWWSTK